MPEWPCHRPWPGATGPLWKSPWRGPGHHRGHGQPEAALGGWEHPTPRRGQRARATVLVHSLSSRGVGKGWGASVGGPGRVQGPVCRAGAAGSHPGWGLSAAAGVRCAAAGGHGLDSLAPWPRPGRRPGGHLGACQCCSPCPCCGDCRDSRGCESTVSCARLLRAGVKPSHPRALLPPQQPLGQGGHHGSCCGVIAWTLHKPGGTCLELGTGTVFVTGVSPLGRTTGSCSSPGLAEEAPRAHAHLCLPSQRLPRGGCPPDSLAGTQWRPGFQGPEATFPGADTLAAPMGCQACGSLEVDRPFLGHPDPCCCPARAYCL